MAWHQNWKEEFEASAGHFEKSLAARGTPERSCETAEGTDGGAEGLVPEEEQGSKCRMAMHRGKGGTKRKKRKAQLPHAPSSTL